MIALLAAPDREDIRAKHPAPALMEMVGGQGIGAPKAGTYLGVRVKQPVAPHSVSTIAVLIHFVSMNR
jgi:hypothetical protein